MNPFKWLYEEAKEKLDVRATWHELKKLGLKHGLRFFVVAVLWEITEDMIFPFLAYKAGYPYLIPVFLVLHFEPVVYPVFFFLFRTWDRLLGREPWEPDRAAASTYWRTALKVMSHRILSLALFFGVLGGYDLGWALVCTYTLGMSLFAFAHDRIWHDSNYGIDPMTDQVQPRRIIGKEISYRLVSVLVMSGVFLGILGQLPLAVGIYQILAFFLSIALSSVWANNSVGVYPVQRISKQ